MKLVYESYLYPRSSNMKLLYGIFFYCLCILAFMFNESTAVKADKGNGHPSQKMDVSLLMSLEKDFLSGLNQTINSGVKKISNQIDESIGLVMYKFVEMQNQYRTIESGWQVDLELCLTKNLEEINARVLNSKDMAIKCGNQIIDVQLKLSMLKEMVKYAKDTMTTAYKRRKEMYKAWMLCDANHGSMRKTIHCIISQSPALKAAMVDMVSLVIEFVVEMIKIVMKGADKECISLIIKNFEEDLIYLLKGVKTCIITNNSKAIQGSAQLGIQNDEVLNFRSEKGNVTKKVTDKIITTDDSKKIAESIGINENVKDVENAE